METFLAYLFTGFILLIIVGVGLGVICLQLSVIRWITPPWVAKSIAKIPEKLKRANEKLKRANEKLKRANEKTKRDLIIKAKRDLIILSKLNKKAWRSVLKPNR